MNIEQLLQVPWFRVPESDRGKACRRALEVGKEVAGRLSRSLPVSDLMPVPEAELYVTHALTAASPEVQRDWRMIGHDRLIQDVRVTWFLDAYARMYRRYHSEVSASYPLEEIDPLIHEKETFLADITRQIEDTQRAMDIARAARSWQKASAAKNVIEGLYVLRHKVRTELEVLNAHRFCILQAPAMLGEPIDNFFRSRKEIKQMQEEALGLVSAALVQPRPKSLCAACWQCLEIGISTRDMRLQEPLIPYVEWLVEDGRLRELAEQVQIEVDRREAQFRPLHRQPETLCPRQRNEEIEQYLQDLLPVTRGKRAVMLGGVCKPGAVETIAHVLELGELQWPTSHENRKVDLNEKMVQKADILYLNRFNRKAARRAYRICKEANTTLVQLGTFGMNHVIYRSWDRLFNRQGGLQALLKAS